jgi:CRP/FNR family transcriptional regulator
VLLPDGDRQILSFLLPGDITSAAAVFLDHSMIAVEAVTDIQYCMIDKAELKSALNNNRRVFDEFLGTWARRKEELEKLAIDLAHKTAEQRIAGLILSLMERHRARNLIEGTRFAFPLRQQHVADATGLTVVHANRVIGIMRKLGLIEIEDRALTVRDLPGLRRFAN